MVFADSGKNMELDIFIREYNLAFEYQGEQHFHNNFVQGIEQTQKST